MTFIEQTGPETAVEATRIFIEAHATTLSPIWEAAERSILSKLQAMKIMDQSVPVSVRMLFSPQGTETSIPFPTDSERDETETTPSSCNLRRLESLWELSDPACGYLLPERGSDYDFQLALILRIGGWERNQPLSGLVIVFWQGSPTGEFPFPTPTASAELPSHENTRFLPLPPRFERTRKTTDTPWIAMPAQILKSEEWSRLESSVADLSKAGSEILQRLVPVLGDAAWKSMARTVMHELARTVSTPYSMLEGARNALLSAYETVSQGSLQLSGEAGQQLVQHLKTVNTNLKEMENDQDYVLSKVNWFFNLVADELGAEEYEPSTLKEVLKQTVEALGCLPSTDLIIENPEHPLWDATLKLPRLFPQHCLEAIISNSFIHRDNALAVRFAITDGQNGDCYLQWTNRSGHTKAQNLIAEQEKPSNSRTFGLRIAESISEAFFGAPLRIQVKPDEKGATVEHSLDLTHKVLTQQVRHETNVSA